jgi:hypothetical protein
MEEAMGVAGGKQFGFVGVDDVIRDRGYFGGEGWRGPQGMEWFDVHVGSSLMTKMCVNCGNI